MAKSLEDVQEFSWTGRTGPFTVLLTPTVFTPSLTSTVLADSLEVHPDDVVLDVGCGCGILSFVAARLGARRIYGCDLSETAVEMARRNARELGLEERTEFRAGNLLEPVADVRADVVIGDVSGIPDPVAELTGWFPDGRGGGPTGAELPVAMLAGLGELIAPGGRLYLPTGTIQAEDTVLAAARAVFGRDNMEMVEERRFPLPPAVARSEVVDRLRADGTLELEQRGSRVLWRLSIWRCTRR